MVVSRKCEIRSQNGMFKVLNGFAIVRDRSQMTDCMTLRILLCLGCLAPLQIMAKDLVVPLWPDGAPGSEQRRNEPEQARDYWIRNIHNPSLTVFLPPKEKANGAAVVICPGGGHRELVFNEEGVKPAKFLNTLGVAAFALKYRLARETTSTYSIERDARLDGQRAMRLVRSRASEWGIDTNRIGMMGFSAGGEIVSLVTYGPRAGDSPANDPIERADCHPDFQILIYPGPLGIPDRIPSDAPPAFLLVANDDKEPSATSVELLRRYRTVGKPIEAHILAQGSHAFNMGDRSSLRSVRDWPQRLADWLTDNQFLQPPPQKP